MNDEILAQQLSETGDLLDLLTNDVWMRETEAVEAECDGKIEAGLGLESYVEQLSTISPVSLRQQRRQTKLISILLPELKKWIQSWGLGLSLEPVYIEAQRRLFRHLQQPTPDQGDWLNALLAEDLQQISLEQKPIRQQVSIMLSQIFTEDDWQALAQTAAEETAKGILNIWQQEEV